MQNVEKKLKKFRSKIDRFDLDLLKALSKRMTVSEKIGILKKKNKLPVVQKKRFDSLMSQRLILAERLGLHKKLVIKIFNLIHRESVAIQDKLLKAGRRK